MYRSNLLQDNDPFLKSVDTKFIIIKNDHKCVDCQLVI